MSSWDVRIEVDPERVPAIRVTTPGLPAGLTTMPLTYEGEGDLG